MQGQSLGFYVGNTCVQVVMSSHCSAQIAIVPRLLGKGKHKLISPSKW